MWSAEAYRRAVELNPRDYRAWYGLGQTYELLRMPFYALYYFRRATQLRPHDARMWCAMGQCYENDQLQSVDKDKMEVAAIRCYRRAVQNGDREGIALHKLVHIVSLHLGCMLEMIMHCTRICTCAGQVACSSARAGFTNSHNQMCPGTAYCIHASAQTSLLDCLTPFCPMQAKLHQARNETREAAHYFKMNLERIEAENISGSDQLDALIYLAEYAKVTVHFSGPILVLSWWCDAATMPGFIERLRLMSLCTEA